MHLLTLFTEISVRISKYNIRKNKGAKECTGKKQEKRNRRIGNV
jgi:hypothetical protein